MSTTKERDRADKEHRAKIRACFDLQLTHIRMGDWRGTKGSSIQSLGTTAQLHGTVCTCCPASRNYLKENL